MKRASIRDVANAAGVSTTTVSLVLAGKGNISAETRKRILTLVEQMNYIPNWNGKNLKGGKSMIIALYVYSIRGYYSQLADAICEEIHKYGYELDIVVADKRESIMSGLLGNRYDGAIILHHAINDDDARVICDSGVPAVFLDRKISGKSVTSVLLESYETGWMGAEYLYRMGHRRIMFVKGTETFDATKRLSGFCDYLHTQGMELDSCIEGAFDRDIAYRAMCEFLKSGKPLPDAIFACNDDSAIGCLKALDESGISVPENVSILGCDDIELCRWYTPSLATLSTGIDRQGVTAARALIELIGGKSVEVLTIPARLVERASCIRKNEQKVNP